MDGMRKHKDVTADGFAARLRMAAQKRGHTSARNKSGVDVSAVATAAGCSYEMARRYVDGLAMPPEPVQRALADWLRVPLAWLALGEDGNATTPLDLRTLEACLAAVEEAQQLAGVELTPARVAALVAALYREAAGGEPVTARAVAASLRALNA